MIGFGTIFLFVLSAALLLFISFIIIKINLFLNRGKETRSFKDVMNCYVFTLTHSIRKCAIINDMKSINRLTYGRTSVYNLNYHIIWGTRYCNWLLKVDL